jgi:hypothetical protein
MAKHISGWNLFMGEKMKAMGDLKQVAGCWHETSERERFWWSEQAKMRNISAAVSSWAPEEQEKPKRKRPLHAYNLFVREQSKHIKTLKQIAALWNALSAVEKEAWKQQ